MSAQLVIPDQIHIDKIRERLWCDREFGRAAVMVGAGFSRNAEKLSPSVPDFPLWVDLAGAMFDGLYHQGDPSISNRDQRRMMETSGLNAVRLASQYEAAFGAHSLDSLIRQNTPDQRHRPGWLHRCLLELPWSDVFTTNYDTLLERTLPSVHERKYDIVLDHLDIPHAMRPRIVKLHGSLDSKRPLIITEEHYRTYPEEFAPFVNMVQQAIMENLLCLVGFSGEDPNFLYWSGWVRDNLGKHAPPIYLVGLRRFTSAEDRLLHNRNVIPIDLSPVLSGANVNPGIAIVCHFLGSSTICCEERLPIGCVGLINRRHHLVLPARFCLACLPLLGLQNTKKRGSETCGRQDLLTRKSFLRLWRHGKPNVRNIRIGQYVREEVVRGYGLIRSTRYWAFCET